MAKIDGITASSLWTFKIEATETSVNIVNNISYVRISAHIGRSNSTNPSYMDGGIITCDVSIAGIGTKTITCDLRGKHVDINPGKWYEIGYVDFDVLHNDDGTKTIDISSSFTRSIGSPASGSANGKFTLTKIARASSVSMSGGVIGSTANITITSASTEYWHLLEYEFYEASGSIVELGAGINSYDWKIPSSLANQIPNTTSGIGTLRCITYNVDTEIGKTEIPIQLSVLNVPTISDYVITVDNGENTKYSDWGVYLSGYSRAKVTAKATAYDGASISRFTIFVGGMGSATVEPTGDNKNELSYTTDIFTSGGTKTIGLNVFDSRELPSSRYTQTIDIHQCVSPLIKTFTVSRKDDDQSKVVIKCNWDYDSVNGKNAAIGKVDYKEGKNGSYTGNPIEVTKGSEVILEDSFDATKSYYFKLIVTDLLEQRDEKEAFISTREVLMDFRAGGKGLSIGKISEADIFEVAMDSQFDNPTTFKQQVIEEYGHYAHLTWAGYEKTGYVRIAKMKVTSAWNDAYLVFDVMQRHKTFSTYYVGFQHVDHAYPEIDTFTYEGDMPGYLVKVAEGEWDLIVKKKERNDFICVVDFKNNPYTNGRTEITWLDVYDAELPTDAIISTPRKQNNVLWSGGNVGAYMSAKKIDEETYETQKCDLSKTPISQQPNGIVLVFSQFDQANNKGLENYMSFFVPKQLVAAQPGATHTFQLNTYNYSAMGTKYLKISDILIEGDIVNEDVGYIDSGKTVLFANNKFVLRYIYGV